jgi:hypothetical protein
METRQVQFQEYLFSFRSKVEWVNKARSWFSQAGYLEGETICLDQKGRICRRGSHFDIADIEAAFPVDVFVVRDDSGDLALKAGERAERYIRRRMNGELKSHER